MKMKLTSWLVAILFIAVSTEAYCAITQTSVVPTLNVTQPTCAHPRGTIEVTSPTGEGYEYSINNGPFQTSPLFSELVPAIYCVRVKDTVGTLYETVCVEIIKLVLPETPTVVITQPNCTTPTGSIAVTMPLGDIYTYSVNGIDFQNSPVFTGLAPGSYDVTVMNQHGCRSKITVVIINMAPNACVSAGIYHTSVTCGNFEDDPQDDLVESLCYRSRNTTLSNIIPGKFYYYTYVTAPSEDFCIDITQTKSGNELALFSIHQENQIRLYTENCSIVSTGTEITLGQGSICISDAIPGMRYILSVKYDSKSLIGSTFTEPDPIYQYTFESSINGLALPNSLAVINLIPNCSLRIAEEPNELLSATLAPNPASEAFNLHIASPSLEPLYVLITDANGRRLKDLKLDYTEKINLGSELSAGLYFIEVTQGNKQTTLRALKF